MARRVGKKPNIAVKEEEILPYSQPYYTALPTGIIKYMRADLCWQFCRFLAVNYRMVRMIGKAHPHPIKPGKRH